MPLQTTGWTRTLLSRLSSSTKGRTANSFPKMNSYLKEIANLCHIRKNLSTHVAKHTFACIVIFIETIAKILGHTNIKTTSIYVRELDSTVKKQMSNLQGKFVTMGSYADTGKQGGTILIIVAGFFIPNSI